jgi:hypothetical protein
MARDMLNWSFRDTERMVRAFVEIVQEHLREGEEDTKMVML